MREKCESLAMETNTDEEERLRSNFVSKSKAKQSIKRKSTSSTEIRTTPINIKIEIKMAVKWNERRPHSIAISVLNFVQNVQMK